LASTAKSKSCQFPDLFAIDAEALHGFMTSFYKEQKYNPQAFVNRRNFFAMAA
jgi:hypothetical protein